MKNRTEILVEKLKLSEILEKLWAYLMVDFITKLLLVAGKDLILVVCDRLSKMTHFVATTISRSKKVNLVYFILFFIFIFFSIYFSIFLFLEKLGLGLISHTVTSVAI